MPEATTTTAVPASGSGGTCKRTSGSNRLWGSILVHTSVTQSFRCADHLGSFAGVSEALGCLSTKACPGGFKLRVANRYMCVTSTTVMGVNEA